MERLESRCVLSQVAAAVDYDPFDFHFPDGEFTPTVMAGQTGGQLGDSPQRRVDPNTTTSPFAGVGLVFIERTTPPFPVVGSGSAISPRHVLTAAHVVDGHSTPPDGVIDLPLASHSFLLNFGGDVTHQIRVSAVHVHPDYATGNLTRDDLAILTLDQDLPAGVPIYPILREPLQLGTVVTIVGYGLSGNGNTGIQFGTGDPSVKRWGQNVVDAFGRSDEGTATPEVFIWDFDHPQGLQPAPIVQLGGHSLGNQVETTMAFGDSGGPSFVTAADGSLAIAGVNTNIFSPRAQSNQFAPDQRLATFGTLAISQVVRAHAAWIDSIIGAGGASAGVNSSTGEPGDDPVSSAEGTWVPLSAGSQAEPPLVSSRTGSGTSREVAMQFLAPWALGVDSPGLAYSQGHADDAPRSTDSERTSHGHPLATAPDELGREHLGEEAYQGFDLPGSQPRGKRLQGFLGTELRSAEAFQGAELDEMEIIT